VASCKLLVAGCCLHVACCMLLLLCCLHFHLENEYEKCSSLTWCTFSTGRFFRGEGGETWDWDCDWELASSSGPCTCTSVVSMAWATCCTRVAEFSVSQPLGNTSWLTWLGFLGSQHSVGRTMGTSSTLSLWGVAQTPWAVAVTVTDVQMDAESAQRKIYSILVIK